MSPEHALVVVPTYNEAENIEQILKRLRTSVPSAEILVVDDGSPDGTGDLVETAAIDDGHIHVLHRQSKAGLGAAYLAGFAWGLDRDYDIFVEMDADGSHRPEELPDLLQALATADLVIGSRWVRGGRVVNWPMRRELLSRAANTYVRCALGMPTRDATAGFRAFRRQTLQGLGLDSVESQGYCFQVDLTRRAFEAGFRISEVPITFVEREYGDSKMDGSVIGEAMTKVTDWGLRKRSGQAVQLVRTLKSRVGRGR